MIIRKLRLQRSWSQEHLAELTGLSTRTIQRIERGEKPALESVRLLADAFGIDTELLQEEITNGKSHSEEGDDMEKHSIRVTSDEKEAIEYVKRLKGFYTHLFVYVVIVTGLFVLNLIVSPHRLWVLWVIFGWGIGISIQAFKIFSPFHILSPEWEKREIEKRLGREL
jgi:transcriptional regulator with XRE-family HTH domain